MDELLADGLAKHKVIRLARWKVGDLAGKLVSHKGGQLAAWWDRKRANLWVAGWDSRKVVWLVYPMEGWMGNWMVGLSGERTTGV